MTSTLPALDRRTPGASLHPLLRGDSPLLRGDSGKRAKAVGVARVKYPKGARFDDVPNPEVMRRLAAGLRRLDAGRS